MEMLATCRIQRPVSLKFGASGVWGEGWAFVAVQYEYNTGTRRAAVTEIWVELRYSIGGVFAGSILSLSFSLLLPSWSATSDLPASSLSE